jgi:hypothetical protein
MVQTGNALIRSHRRSANSLASMMFQLRAQAVPLSPAARQVQAQAEASDETTASNATATTNEASIPLILIPPQPTRQCRISGCGALTAVTSHREANGIRVRQIGNMGVPHILRMRKRRRFNIIGRRRSWCRGGLPLYRRHKKSSGLSLWRLMSKGAIEFELDRRT